MRDRLVKKWLVLSIILLFIGTSVVPIVGSRTNNLKVTIGETFFSEWAYEPDIIVPDDYPTIQEAVDAANQGECIGVRAGEYDENIIINTDDLILCGDLETETIIDGNENGNTVLVDETNDVIINGFHITGSNRIEEGCSGIKIVDSIGTVIEKNFIYGNSNGVYFTDSYDIVIKRNNIFNNTFSEGCGIFSLNSSVLSLDDVTFEWGIWNNTIKGNNIGISIYNTVTSADNIFFVSWNNILDNSVGIFIISGMHIYVVGNRFIGSNYSIQATASYDLSIVGNSFDAPNSFSLCLLYFCVANNFDCTKQILLLNAQSFGIAISNWWKSDNDFNLWPRRRVAPFYAPVLLSPWALKPHELDLPPI